MNDEDLIQENDHFEIPEEYLHMNLEKCGWSWKEKFLKAEVKKENKCIAY